MSKKKVKKYQDNLKSCTYFVEGMHCASCEVLIEKKLLKQENIKSADATLNEGKVKFTYVGSKPEAEF